MLPVSVDGVNVLETMALALATSFPPLPVFIGPAGDSSLAQMWLS